LYIKESFYGVHDSSLSAILSHDPKTVLKSFTQSWS